MKQTIILSGKSGAGKDMCAMFMRQALEAEGKKVMVIHFADVLKYFLREYYEYDGDKSKPQNRTLLQRVGTDMVRAKYENYWASIVLGFLSVEEDYDDFDVALVPDARFENEIDLLMTFLRHCVVVRVERMNADGSAWINPNFTAEQLEHPSETSLDDYGFDYVIHNDEGLEMLRESAYTVLRDLNLL